jgi:hypothetical protein
MSGRKTDRVISTIRHRQASEETDGAVGEGNEVRVSGGEDGTDRSPGKLPHEVRVEHFWRTWKDPFDDVWRGLKKR